jgi:protein-tyrosine phosphatase
MKRILFLCTGNYYRSRFAEALFNHLAQQSGLKARAASRGLRVKPDGVTNVGPISRHALEGLAARATAPPPEEYPRQVTEGDLRKADVIIALKEAEHRPLMESQFPAHAPQVRYWHVHDLDAAPPADALAELETLVRELAAHIERKP